MKIVSIKEFGKDHWSLFAYVETRIVDYGGKLDKAHLRIKNKEEQAGDTSFMLRPDWSPEYGTRLAGYFPKDSTGNANKSFMIPDHDDLDCLEDLEKADLIKSVGTGMFPAYNLTKYGVKIASLLRQHKGEGKNFADFSI